MFGRATPPVALLVTVFTCFVPAAGAGVLPTSGGVIHACLTTRGAPATRASLRVVASARKCRTGRGERPIAWSVTGFSGPAGPTGATGAEGAPGVAGTAGAVGATGATGPQGLQGAAGLQGLTGPQGPIGPEGPAAEINEALEATVEDQSAEIEALQTQLSMVCAQVDKIATAVGGISLLNPLPGLGLSIPTLPSPLATKGCP